MLRQAPVRAPRALSAIAWALAGVAVLVQICYPLVPQALQAAVTVASVGTFCAAALADAARVHGPRGALTLLAVAGGGGLAAEVVGLRTGFPFGGYAYTGGLGPQVLGVPVVVPLAWTMMAWPALVVGRTLARGRAVPLVAAWALASWDVFLDPQMVDAGHWRWQYPEPALPLVPGVPLTNYAGWLLVALLLAGLLDRLLGPHPGPPGPAGALYLWVFVSSVLAHLAFFDRPGSALAGAVLMGLTAVPFAAALGAPGRRGPRRDTARVSSRSPAGSAPSAARWPSASGAASAGGRSG